MDQFTAPQRALCVRAYYETKSVHFVRTLFQSLFQTKPLPTTRMIQQWVLTFEETGYTLRSKDTKPVAVKRPADDSNKENISPASPDRESTPEHIPASQIVETPRAPRKIKKPCLLSL